MNEKQRVVPMEFLLQVHCRQSHNKTVKINQTAGTINNKLTCCGVTLDEVAARLEEFNQKSSELYSNILAALGKNGVVSGSQNMTAMAQQSTRIASDQV